MYRLGLGLRPVSQCSLRADSQSESSSDSGSDEDYGGGSRKRKSDNDSEFAATESESEETADDSSDSTYEEPSSKRSRPSRRRSIVPPPRKRKRGTSSSDGENSWSGSEWSDAYRPKKTMRLSAKPIKYNENSSGSSAEEEKVEEEVTVEDEEEEREEVEEGEGHADVETIEKILRERVGRKGATGDETISYNVAEKGDPNAGVDPETEETEKQFLIKWKGWSHIHNTWESEESLRLANANGMIKLKNFQQRQFNLKLRLDLANEEDREYLMCQQEKEEQIEDRHATAERIIQKKTDYDGSVEYLVKWEGLQYSQTTLEDAKLIDRLFPEVVDEYRERLVNMRAPDPRASALRQRPKFVQLREQPARLGERNQLVLRDYQLEGLNWLLGAWCRWNGVILADEMGLGKTIQTISLIEVLMSSHHIYGPFLILVPLSTISNWHEEFHSWAPHINVIEYVGDKQSRVKIRDFEWKRTTEKSGGGLNFNVLLTTFEILLKDEAELRVINWSALVVDEAHRLKNDESGLYRCLIPFKTNHRLLITGTPLQNNLKELWALLHFVMPDRYRVWEDFERRFSLTDKSGFESLHKELTPFILRRIKKDVEKSLPAKTERILRVEMSKVQKHFYRLILTKNLTELQKGITGKVSSFINIVMELKKCCNHLFLISHDTSFGLESLIRGSGKLILLDKLLTRLKETGHRVLIFSQMVRMLDLLESYMRFRRFAFQRLDGSIHGDKRKQALEHFNADGSQDFCFLLSTRAGGLGLNLATADTVIIFDSDWNPQNDLQAQARAHRIGQKNQVSVYRLVTKNSVEENILESAKKKMVLDHLVIQSMDTTGKTILEKDFQSTKNPFSKEELNAILKFGAEELFKNNDDEDADLQMDIDDILQRAETRSAEEMANGGSSDLLAGFKVVSFDNLEEEETEGKEEEKSWNDIIPEDVRRRLEEEERSQLLVSMHLPPRNRKNFQTINYDESNGRNKKSRRNDANGQKDSTNDVSSESQDVLGGEGGGYPKKRGRPRHTYEEVKGLTTKELKALVKSLKKFGRPLERIHAIARDCHLVERNINDLVKVVETILSKCTEAMETMSKAVAQPRAEDGGVSGHKNLTFKLAKVIITPKSILDAIEYLEPLCLWYLDEHNEIPSAIHLKPTDFNCPWAAEDDVNLLKGIFKYGLGSWQTIKTKTKYRLSKILPENSTEKPQGKHLSSRVEYLLNKLRKHYKDADESKKKKKPKTPTHEDTKLKILKQRVNGGGDPIVSNKSSSVAVSSSTSNSKSKSKTDKLKYSDKELQDNDQHTGDAQSCLKCKSDMYPVRKSLKLLQRDDLFDQCLLSAGDQIRLLLSQHQDRSTAEDRKRHLWQFVGCFCGLAAEELHRFYKKLSRDRNSTTGSRSQKTSASTDRGSSL